MARSTNEVPFRFVWEQRLRDADLNDGGGVQVVTLKGVALCLGTYADMNGGKVRPSQATIATALGMSVKQVQRAMKRLRELGWISVTEGSTGKGTVTHYRLTTPDTHVLGTAESEPPTPDTHVLGTQDIQTPTQDTHVLPPRTPMSLYQSNDQSTLTSPILTTKEESSGGKEGKNETNSQTEQPKPVADITNAGGFASAFQNATDLVRLESVRRRLDETSIVQDSLLPIYEGRKADLQAAEMFEEDTLDS